MDDAKFQELLEKYTPRHANGKPYLTEFARILSVIPSRPISKQRISHWFKGRYKPEKGDMFQLYNWTTEGVPHDFARDYLILAGELPPETDGD